jgi:3-methyladenine DNA glycosylase/8-oxoguanine DNA glycosylase
MNWRLTARLPFSLYAVVRSHGWIRLVPFVAGEGDRSLRYVARMASGQVVELEITEAEGGVSVAVDAELDEGEQADVSAQVRWMLGLDQDLSAFYALARSEPKLARVEARAQGRVLRSPTLFEDTVKTILTTNTAWSGTVRMVEALVSLYGTSLPADPARAAFPTPEQVAAAGPEALRDEARLGYRAPYAFELARAVASGALDLEALKTSDLPTPDLRKRLLAIKGVGDYAAANLLVILGRYDWVPVDSWAIKVVSHEWYEGRPIGRAEVEAAFERWGAWRGLAYWFWDWAYLAEEQG